MKILKSFIKISLITTLSRILGFMRDIIIARTFGAKIETDSFFITFKLINLLRRIFAEGALYQAFVPILTDYKTKKEKKKHADSSVMLQVFYCYR